MPLGIKYRGFRTTSRYYDTLYPIHACIVHLNDCSIHCACADRIRHLPFITSRRCESTQLKFEGKIVIFFRKNKKKSISCATAIATPRTPNIITHERVISLFPPILIIFQNYD